MFSDIASAPRAVTTGSRTAEAGICQNDAVPRGRDKEGHASDYRNLASEAREWVRRSLQEFLYVPLAIIFGFVVLAVITSILDRSDAGWLKPAALALSKLAPEEENQSMLRTVAPGMLTLMTITFVLLLMLVHRMSDVFTWVVVEQFLRRRVNQTFSDTSPGCRLTS